MTNTCYEGTVVPEQIIEPCEGIYTKTDCIVHEAAITYLELPANTSLTQVIYNMVLSLQAKDTLISDLQNQINNL
jgi:hypothetical protein